MLCHRVVCVLLYRPPGILVKGERFSHDRCVGSALQAARVHARRQVDELILLDVTATQDGREPDYALIERVTDSCFVPVAAGGGIRTEEHVRKLLRAGADKVVIGTAAVERLSILKPLIERFGSQCLTVAVDARYGWAWTHSGTCPSHLRAADVAGTAARVGAGEILLTDIDRDGKLQGYNLGLCRRVREEISVPLVLAGGAGTYEHLADGLEAGADAVAAGAMWQFTEHTPAGAAQYIAERGYSVRVPEGGTT